MKKRKWQSPLKSKNFVKIRKLLDQCSKRPLFPAAAEKTAKTQVQDLIFKDIRTTKKTWAKSWQTSDKIWVLIGTGGHRNLEGGYLGGWARNAKPQDSLELSALGGAAPPNSLLEDSSVLLPEDPGGARKDRVCLLQHLPLPPLTSSKPIIRICSSIITFWERRYSSCSGRKAHPPKELQDLDINTVRADTESAVPGG